jgi:hypothetical protein
MRILSIENIELTNPDLSCGYLKNDRIFVKHHKAVERVDEQWHYEVIATYPNGGQDVRKVVDVPGVEAVEAWDEYEDIERYIEYTEEELAQMHQPSQPSVEERLDRIEKMFEKFFDNKSMKDGE